MRNTITRSFVKNLCTVTVYANGELSEKKVYIPCGYNDNASAERYIRRNNLDIGGKLVEVNCIEKISSLYGMEESTFIKLAKVVDERSKDTRNSITKTIISNSATMVCMSDKRTIVEDNVTYPCNIGKKELAAFISSVLPNGYKFIELTDFKKSEKLYALDEETFIKNAKQMRDHFHYIDE